MQTELLMKKDLMRIWKMKCLEMLSAPLLLFKEKEMEDEAKELNKDKMYKSAMPLKLNKDQRPGTKK